MSIYQSESSEITFRMQLYIKNGTCWLDCDLVTLMYRDPHHTGFPENLEQHFRCLLSCISVWQLFIWAVPGLFGRALTARILVEVLAPELVLPCFGQYCLLPIKIFGRTLAKPSGVIEFEVIKFGMANCTQLSTVRDNSPSPSHWLLGCWSY